MSPRVLVFDYDGTLAASNAVKRAAYRPLFPASPRFDRAVEEALLRQVGGTRFDVLRDIVTREKLCVETRREAEVNRLAAVYDSVATDGAATCPERPGATRVLQWLSERLPLYLLSLTPEESLRRIIDRRDWTSYFRAIRGAPCRKEEEIRAFAAHEGVSCPETLMVGDSEEDRVAARRAGAGFLFVEEGMTMDDMLERIHLSPCAPECRP